jgi:hypothetical protein
MGDGPNIGLTAALAPLQGDVAGAPTQIPGGRPAEAPAPELFDDLDGPEGAEGPVTRQIAARGRGRPPGSPNKRTADLRRFVLARFKHPVVALMEIAGMGADELATYLGCKPVEALNLQLRALAEAAPYVDSKMPLRLAIADTDRLPAFTLHFGGGGVDIADPAGNRVTLTDLRARAKTAMDQRLIEGEAIKSHDDASHDGGQAVDSVDYSAI